jgi:hypothetical protein
VESALVKICGLTVDAGEASMNWQDDYDLNESTAKVPEWPYPDVHYPFKTVAKEVNSEIFFVPFVSEFFFSYVKKMIFFCQAQLYFKIELLAKTPAGTPVAQLQPPSPNVALTTSRQLNIEMENPVDIVLQAVPYLHADVWVDERTKCVLTDLHLLGNRLFVPAELGGAASINCYLIPSMMKDHLSIERKFKEFLFTRKQYYLIARLVQHHDTMLFYRQVSCAANFCSKAQFENLHFNSSFKICHFIL